MHNTSAVVLTGSYDHKKYINVQINFVNSRSLCGSTNILYSGNKLEDFRAREEEKETKFNIEPFVTKNDKEKEEHPNDEDASVTEVKNKILEASLGFVESSGWTRQSIVKGAEQAGYPGTVHGMFPKGGIELINYFYLKGNKEMVEEMREKVGENSENVGNSKDFVRWALQLRLEKLHPYIKTWPQALAMMSLPPNVPTSLANLLTLVDEICYYSGDRSVDVS